MKFRIAHLGRIKSAELDIKPLTIFIGKNNTNKTWSAYSLYGILRSMTWFMRSGFSTGQPLPSCGELDSAVSTIARRTANLLAAQTETAGQQAQQSFTLEVTRDEVLREAAFGTVPVFMTLSGENLAKVLAVDLPVVERSEATLTCDAEWFRINGKVKSLIFVKTGQPPTVTITGKSPAGVQWPVLTFSSLSEKMTADYIFDQIYMCIRWLVFAIFNDALGFPAERKAIAALLSQLEPVQREAKFRAVLNVPSLDFISFLLTARRRTDANPKFANVINLLEQNVLNGQVEFQGPTEARVFNYRSENGPPIQIHAVASLVRSLAGFDVYLRHHSHEIIVVDEPEMNAHPDAQLKLVELFAILANLGLRIIITTHSPYFLDHLNNLIEGGTLDGESKARIAKMTKLGDPGAFISPDKVAAYLFQDDGNVTDLIDDGIIDVASFASESDYASNLYSEIRHAKTVE